MSNALKALLAAELAIAAAPFQSALKKIAEGDGSAESVVAAGVSLQADLVSAVPAVKSVGIHNVAADLAQMLDAFVAKQTASITEDKPEEKAAAEATPAVAGDTADKASE